MQSWKSTIIGKAGTLTVSATSLSIDGTGIGVDADLVSNISAESAGAGDAGAVTVNVSDNISITGGALIGISIGGSGNAGSIIVSAASLGETRDASIDCR